MSSWSEPELEGIGAAEELLIASLRADGTLSRSTIIWVVRLDDEIYVRSYLGRGSSWFRRVLVRHEGHIRAGGADRDVVFVEVADPDVNDDIDDQYREKYQRYSKSVVDSVMTPDARSATLKLIPR